MAKPGLKIPPDFFSSFPQQRVVFFFPRVPPPPPFFVSFFPPRRLPQNTGFFCSAFFSPPVLQGPIPVGGPGKNKISKPSFFPVFFVPPPAGPPFLFPFWVFPTPPPRNKFPWTTQTNNKEPGPPHFYALACFPPPKAGPKDEFGGFCRFINFSDPQSPETKKAPPTPQPYWAQKKTAFFF